MLLIRSPNLEELIIDAFSDRYIDIRPVYAGRWPKLRKLSLGDFVLLDGFSGSTAPSTNCPAMTFLAAHQSLESLMLHHVEGWYFPLELELPPSALPCLKTFSGTFLHVEGLTNPSSLKSLQLTSHPHRSYRVPAVCKALRTLHSLASLSIWLECAEFAAGGPRDDHKSFHNLLCCCPQLSDLEIYCSSDPPFDMVSVQLSIIQLGKSNESDDVSRDISYPHFTAPRGSNHSSLQNCPTLKTGA